MFASPLAMADAVPELAEHLAAHVEGLDADVVAGAAEELVTDLEALAAEVEDVLAAVPEERRVLVTDHDVFAWFARDFGFAVVGTVIPGSSTADGVSGGALAALADTVRAEGVRAVFTSSTAPADLVETLADEAGVAVVALYAESLGAPGTEGDTYRGMVLTNAERIAAALAA